LMRCLLRCCRAAGTRCCSWTTPSTTLMCAPARHLCIAQPLAA
jgi:hypothetical protein